MHARLKLPFDLFKNGLNTFRLKKDLLTQTIKYVLAYLFCMAMICGTVRFFYPDCFSCNFNLQCKFVLTMTGLLFYALMWWHIRRFKNIVLLLCFPLIALWFSVMNFPDSCKYGYLIFAEYCSWGGIALIFLSWVSVSALINKRICHFFNIWFQWIVLLLLFFDVWVFYSGLVTDEHTLLAIIQTSPKEAWEYCLDKKYTVCLFILVMISLFPACYHLTNCTDPKRDSSLRKMYWIPVLLFLLLSVGLTYINIKNERFFINHWINVIKMYKNGIAELKNQKMNFNKASVKLSDKYKITREINLAVLISESHCRRYMNKYNSPFIEKMKQNKQQFIYFENAYSCFPHTLQVISMALTNKNQYIRNSDVIGLPGLLSQLGYNTHWLSNQYQYGVYGESTISVLAEQCSNVFFQRQFEPIEFYSKEKMDLDFVLLPHLPRLMKGKNILFMHLFACHLPYVSHAQFRNLPVSEYDKSLRTTDFFVETLLPRLEQSGCDAVIFLSDHGEAAQNHIGHDSRKIRVAMMEIPCWIYLSKKFINTYPETARMIRYAGKRIWTNDLLWNLIGGLLGISGPGFPDALNVFSDKYMIRSLEDAKTLYGKMTVKELFSTYAIE